MILDYDLLTEDFFYRDVFIVAKEILGKLLIKYEADTTLISRITEVEVYTIDDPASHSYGGKKNRNSTMFNGGGYLYVYFTYGMYHCANIVTGKENEGSAILIRSAEPLFGIETFAQRRYNKSEITNKEKINLLNGPGKLTIAYDIDKNLNGLKLQEGIIKIADDNYTNFEIGCSERIGISKAKELKRRFFIKNSNYLSRNENRKDINNKN